MYSSISSYGVTKGLFQTFIFLLIMVLKGCCARSSGVNVIQHSTPWASQLKNTRHLVYPYVSNSRWPICLVYYFMKCLKATSLVPILRNRLNSRLTDLKKTLSDVYLSPVMAVIDRLVRLILCFVYSPCPAQWCCNLYRTIVTLDEWFYNINWNFIQNIWTMLVPKD